MNTTKSAKNLIATQSNHLIEASYKLDLIEKRVVLCLLSKVDPRKPLPKTFYLDANEYSKITDTNLKSAYKDLKSGTKGLMYTVITTYDKNAKIGTLIHWMDSITYYDDEGRIEATFSETVRPYISLLAKQFTSIQTEHVAKFRSFYAIRIFELIMQFKNKGMRTITLNNLRQMLQIGEKQYPSYSGFRRRVIEPAVKEINQKSYWVVTWEPIKAGSTIKSLRFHFQEDNQVDMFADL